MNYDLNRLQRARLLKGWNKTALARLINVDPAVIGRIESGQNRNIVTVKKMADALGISMDELLIDKSDHTQPEPQPAA